MKQPSSRGFVLFHRSKFFDDPLWKQPREFCEFDAWIDIYFNLTRGKGDGRLQRGQFQASYGEMAKRLQWSAARVRRFLEALTPSRIELIRPAFRRSPAIYKVCNFEDEQSLGRAKSLSRESGTVEPTPVLAFEPVADTVDTVNDRVADTVERPSLQAETPVADTVVATVCDTPPYKLREEDESKKITSSSQPPSSQSDRSLDDDNSASRSGALAQQDSASYADSVRQLCSQLPRVALPRVPADVGVIAADLHRRAVPIEVVELAIWITAGHWLTGWSNGGQPRPIRSMKYFVPEIEKLAQERKKLNQPLAIYTQYARSRTLEFVTDRIPP